MQCCRARISATVNPNASKYQMKCGESHFTESSKKPETQMALAQTAAVAILTTTSVIDPFLQTKKTHNHRALRAERES